MDIEKLRKMQRRGEELTDEEFEALNNWWAEQRRNPTTPSDAAPSSYTAAGLGIKLEVPTGLKCFKCGAPLHEVTATFGKIPKFLKMEEIDPFTGIVDEKVFVTNSRVAACADHSLLIKPTNGKNHSLDFRNFDQ